LIVVYDQKQDNFPTSYNKDESRYHDGYNLARKFVLPFLGTFTDY